MFLQSKNASLPTSSSTYSFTFPNMYGNITIFNLVSRVGLKNPCPSNKFYVLFFKFWSNFLARALETNFWCILILSYFLALICWILRFYKYAYILTNIYPLPAPNAFSIPPALISGLLLALYFLAVRIISTTLS